MLDKKKKCNCLTMGNTESAQKSGHSTSSHGTLTNNLMRHRDGDVLDKYEVVKTIGEGSMGAISKAKIRDHKIGGSAYQTQEETLCGCFKFLFGGGKKHSFISQSQRRSEEVYYALKTIVLGRVSPEFIKELRNEIDILQSMDHPNIVKAFEVFENKVQIFIVMELCSGGDLYKRLPYSERDASSISSKLCSAIAYMHSKDIVHRDLKFENIMWESDAPDAEIKVIDFGLSKKFLPTERHRTMTEGVGTIYTMAPQVLQGIYTSQADLWSLGVISFMLVSSQKPFYHKRRRQVIDRIMRCDYNFQGQIWEMASAESKDFINKLLVLDPKLRMNASQALKHPWLTKQFRLSMRKPAGEMLLKVQGNLLAFKDTSALKKVALNVIAHKSSTNEIYHLREAFKEYDTGNDGVICFDEFKMALKQSNFSDEELEQIFLSIDVNANGHIMYTEFLAATIEVKGAIEEERIAEAFDRLDSDDSGYISPENLRGILGEGYTRKEIEDLIAEVDHDRDGQISFEEFKTIFQKNTDALATQACLLPVDSTMEDGTTLVGIDAKIPGGKYDVSKGSTT